MNRCDEIGNYNCNYQINVSKTSRQSQEKPLRLYVEEHQETKMYSLLVRSVRNTVLVDSFGKFSRIKTKKVEQRDYASKYALKMTEI